jgi:hypothetical protein
MLGSMGRMLLAMGVLLALVGVLFLLAARFPGLRIGRLPGDIAIEREHFKLYIPLGTSILLSVILSLLFWLFGRRS